MASTSFARASSEPGSGRFRRESASRASLRPEIESDVSASASQSSALRDAASTASTRRRSARDRVLSIPLGDIPPKTSRSSL